MSRYFAAGLMGIMVSCTSGINNPDSISALETSMSGHVSGLEGTLILKTNLGETVTIQQNGSFDFPTELSPNSEYVLTVAEEPCLQRCTLDHTSGKVSSDGKIFLSIECTEKTWTIPKSLSDSVSFLNTESESVEVTLNKDGDKVITWSQYDSFNHLVLYKKEFRNRAWIGPVSPSDYFSIEGGDVKGHSVSINNHGETSIAWVQSDGLYDQTYIGLFKNGTWSYPDSIYDRISVAGSNVITDGNPINIRLNDLGNTVVGWVQENGSDREVFRALQQGGMWNFPETFSDNISPDGGGSSVVSSDIAMNQKGDYVIVWEQSDGPHTEIYKAESRAGILSYPVDLASYISLKDSEAHKPKVAMDEEGNTIIVWYQRGGSHPDDPYQIFKAEYRDGSWSYPANFSDNVSSDGLNSYSPNVAMNNLGHTIIAWRQEDSENGHRQIYKKEFSQGKWHSVNRISPSGTNTYTPKVGLDNDDNALIAWRQESIDGSGIYHMMKSEYRAGEWKNPTSTSDQVSPGSTNVTTPEIAVNHCRMDIVWKQLDANGLYQVYTAEYR